MVWGIILFYCHSEGGTTEESLTDLLQMHVEILRYAQDDKKITLRMTVGGCHSEGGTTEESLTDLL